MLKLSLKYIISIILGILIANMLYKSVDQDLILISY